MSKIQYQRQISIKNKIDNFYERKRESILDYCRTKVNFYPIFKGLFGLYGLAMGYCITSTLTAYSKDVTRSNLQIEIL